MAHTWLALLYAVGCIFVAYILNHWANALLLFLAAEIPMAVLATAVVRENKRLNFRVPLLWTLTITLVWAYRWSSDSGKPTAWVPICFGLLLIYFLVRALMGSVEEFESATSDQSIALPIAALVSAWGATLQVAFLFSIVIVPLLRPVLQSTWLGGVLLTILAAIRLTSPWSWFPAGLLLLGLSLYASVRLEDDPYQPKDYSEIMPVADAPPIIRELLTALRLPTWLCVVIIGFVVHFVKQIWISFQAFISQWAGRLLLIVCGLVLPTVIIIAGHWSTLSAVSLISRYLSSGPYDILQLAVMFIKLHALILMSLCLYIVFLVPLALKISAVPMQTAITMVRSYVIQDGLPVANSLGRSFSLFGILLFAVPIAVLLPGGSSFGPFSIIYGALVIGAFSYYTFRSAAEPPRSTAEPQKDRSASAG